MQLCVVICVSVCTVELHCCSLCVKVHWNVLSSATRDTFTIDFVCDPNSHPGSLKFLREEMNTLPNHVVHDVLFEFSTALACIPAPVDCQIAGMDKYNSWDLIEVRNLYDPSCTCRFSREYIRPEAPDPEQRRQPVDRHSYRCSYITQLLHQCLRTPPSCERLSRLI